MLLHSSDAQRSFRIHLNQHISFPSYPMMERELRSKDYLRRRFSVELGIWSFHPPVLESRIPNAGKAHQF
jgi:hypothetical protein